MARFTYSLRSLLLFTTVLAVAVFIFATLPAVMLLKAYLTGVVATLALLTILHFKLLIEPWRSLASRFVNSLLGCEGGVFMLIIGNALLSSKLGIVGNWEYVIRVGAGLGFVLGMLVPVSPETQD